MLEKLVNHQTFSRDRNNDNPAPDSFRALGYPAFLVTLILASDSVGADPYKAILTTQAVLGAAILLITYLLAGNADCAGSLGTCRGIADGFITSRGVAGVVFTDRNPIHVFHKPGCVESTLAVRWQSYLWGLIAGTALGLTYFVNPTSLVVGPFVFLCLVLFRKEGFPWHWKSQLSFALTVFMPLVTLVALWQLRTMINVSPTEETSSDRLLMNLIAGMFSDYHDIWRANPRDPNNPATLASSRIGGSFALWLRELLGMFMSDPLATIRWYFIDKPLLLWDWNIRIGQGDIYVYPGFYSLYDLSSIALASYAIMHSLHFWLLMISTIGLFLVATEKGKKKALA